MTLYLLLTERMEAAIQGITAAKEFRAEKDRKIAEKVKTQSTKKHDTSAEYLARFFRAASPRSVEMGRARIMLEDAVKRAERILLEKKRAQMAATASIEDQAEVLAEELFHTPGSLLSKEEFARIYQEIPECIDAREFIDCHKTFPFVDTVRTADGTCNNLIESTRGSSFTAFRRLIGASYEDGIQQLNGFAQSLGTLDSTVQGPFTPPFPSARLISSNIVRDQLGNDTNLNHLVMQWGQFIDHDLDLNVEISPEEADCDTANCVNTEVCAPVRVPPNDAAFGVGEPRNGECLPFARTLPVCTTREFAVRNPVNELTHYVDASMIYGSTQDVADFLREFEGGRLRVGPAFPANGGKPSLPEVPATPPCLPNEPRRSEIPPPPRCCPEGRESCFTAGDRRVNEHASLTVMHTIWVREHNRIATELASLNPQWDDEHIYQETRKIVIAQIQRITYEEFLPALFGQDFFNRMIGPYPGYHRLTNPSILNSFATAAFRFGHSLIQNAFDRLDSNLLSIPEGPLSLRDAFMNPQAYFDGQGTDPIIRGWLNQPSRTMDEFLTTVLTTQLFEREEGLGMDLATLNIQRSRDHGLQPHAFWENVCLNSFRGVLTRNMFRFSNLLTQTRFLQTYGGLNSVDLWVGGLAEEPIPGGVIGPTFACLFAITFNDLREGDRFWYENDNVFTPTQLTEIKRTSLARVLCDNGDDISSVQENAFLLSREQLSCSGIPRIDLSAWKDDPLCFQRVRIEPTTQELLIYFQSDLLLPDTQRRSYPLLQGEGRETPYEICVPFICPTERPTLISNFPADYSNFFSCQVTPNSNLPRSSTYIQSAYEATLTRQNIQASSGLFTDLNSCQQSTATVAFSFRCQNQYYYNTDGTDGQEILQRSNTLLPRFNITEAIEYEPLRIAPAIVDFIKSAPMNLVRLLEI